MTNLFTQVQVQALCVTAGFASAEAKTAAAIAMCEGPGATPGTADFDLVGDQALADVTWGFSYGAFQVRSLRIDKGTGRFRDQMRLPNPAFNCASAHTIFVASGFNAWSTYASGQYRAYLQDQFPPAPGTYVVVAGDTLGAVAAKLGLGAEWRALAAANNIPDPFWLTIGQVLQLPYITYTVQPRDTLSGIAARGITTASWQQIAAANHLVDPYLIYPLQKLRLPR